jgi:hypothetical protein
MARIRTIKPEFCTSRDTGALSRDARLFFLQLLTEADDAGRMQWIPRRLCGVLYPHDEDVTSAMLIAWAQECAARGMLQLYSVEGSDYCAITNWHKHQKVDHASKSRIPEPRDSLASDSRESRESLAPDLGTGNREQGTGKPPREPRESLPELVKAEYNAALPNCQQAEVLGPVRERRIRQADKLARQVCEQQGWDYDPTQFWRAYFAECAGDPWRRGDVPNPKSPKWKQNLEVLVSEKQFTQIMDAAISAMKEPA